ncbi:MAG: hypothetical protein A2V85_12145 [Chloroflexi bacterium RBG_16_72_14]|nr:MAG: hypothetical protein A2V85_12145 [Chloroflexi bacterium RBG_16_72_14]
MHGIKRLFLVAATVAALTLALAPAAAASSKSFYLDKTCAEDASEPLGFVCTVTHSSFKWIPPGTDIHYAAIPPLDPLVVQAATIRIKNGSTTGACVWSSDVDAVCTFDRGTGRLTEFHLVVVVTASEDLSIWYWNGDYSFGG